MTNKLNLKYVSDIIAEDINDWEKGDTIIIKAQTGTGKTHFIINNVIPRLQSHETLLYVCNRVELKRQIKIDVAKEVGVLSDFLTITGDIDINKLDNTTRFNNVTIISYHELSEYKLNDIYNKDKKRYFAQFDYVVCDECHYFLTDAGFNTKTAWAFDDLVVSTLAHQVRIFMSATINEVKNTIKHCAQRSGTWNSIMNSVHEYTTGIDYSYLNVKYFDKLRTIKTLIKNDTTEEKWLVFVTKKQHGEELKKQLSQNGITVDFIHSDSNNTELSSQIINTSKFNSKVLIATKTLDNGVNIKDDKVTNLVVMAFDKTTFIQEIGRKRININDAQQVNLYIPMMNGSNFHGNFVKLKDKMDMLDLFNDDINTFRRKYNHETAKIHNDIFYLDSKNQWNINIIGSFRLYTDIIYYENMRNRFKDDKFAFVKEQLSWLGLESKFNEDNLILDVIDVEEVNKLEMYLESIVGKRLYSEEQQELSDLIIKSLTGIIKVDNRTKKLKPSTIEKLIEDELKLNYVISTPKKESKGKNRGKRYIMISKSS